MNNLQSLYDDKDARIKELQQDNQRLQFLLKDNKGTRDQEESIKNLTSQLLRTLDLLADIGNIFYNSDQSDEVRIGFKVKSIIDAINVKCAKEFAKRD